MLGTWALSMYTLLATTGMLSGRHAVPLTQDDYLWMRRTCAPRATICRRRSRSDLEQEALWSLESGCVDMALLFYTYNTTMKMCAWILQALPAMMLRAGRPEVRPREDQTATVPSVRLGGEGIWETRELGRPNLKRAARAYTAAVL